MPSYHLRSSRNDEAISTLRKQILLQQITDEQIVSHFQNNSLEASLFLQESVYVFVHRMKKTPSLDQALIILINNKHFLVKEKDTPHLWLDEKERWTFLTSLAKYGNGQIINIALQKLDTAFGGKNTDGFRAFLTQPNKDQFSPLNTASKEGHLKSGRLRRQLSKPLRV